MGRTIGRRSGTSTGDEMRPFVFRNVIFSVFAHPALLEHCGFISVGGDDEAHVFLLQRHAFHDVTKMLLEDGRVVWANTCWIERKCRKGEWDALMKDVPIV